MSGLGIGKVGASGIVREGAYVVHILRERARSYSRDAEIMVHDGGFTAGDIAIMTTVRDELRKLADEIEAL